MPLPPYAATERALPPEPWPSSGWLSASALSCPGDANEVTARVLLLGVPVARIRSFGDTWSDGGLWDDILLLAELVWTAPNDDERRLRWHHLVMAIGNFKRQSGRRLRPARISPAQTTAPAARADRFCVPGGPEVIRDDAGSWKQLEKSLRGAATATTTTILATLWPDSHHILDWRVLAAVTGLGILVGGDNDLRLAAADSRIQLQPTLEHYAPVRTLMIKLTEQAGLHVTTLERALYLMSRAVPGNGMTWAEYGRALAAAVPDSGTTAHDDGTPDDEQEIPPSAP